MSIHRAGCSNLQALIRRQPERVVEVAWGAQADARYPVELITGSLSEAGRGIHTGVPMLAAQMGLMLDFMTHRES